MEGTASRRECLHSRENDVINRARYPLNGTVLNLLQILAIFDSVSAATFWRRRNKMADRISLTNLRMIPRSEAESYLLIDDTAPDILYCIFPYLSAADFLKLTNCTVRF